MTIFIHEFFGISLDASTVSLYNRGMIYMTKYIIGEIFISSGAILYNDSANQCVQIIMVKLGIIV